MINIGFCHCNDGSPRTHYLPLDPFSTRKDVMALLEFLQRHSDISTLDLMSVTMELGNRIKKYSRAIKADGSGLFSAVWEWWEVPLIDVFDFANGFVAPLRIAIKFVSALMIWPFITATVLLVGPARIVGSAMEILFGHSLPENEFSLSVAIRFADFIKHNKTLDSIELGEFPMSLHLQITKEITAALLENHTLKELTWESSCRWWARRQNEKEYKDAEKTCREALDRCFAKRKMNSSLLPLLITFHQGHGQGESPVSMLPADMLAKISSYLYSSEQKKEFKTEEISKNVCAAASNH